MCSWSLGNSLRAQKVTGVSEEDDEDLPMVDQEYDSAATSINSNKLPAIYKMVSFNPGDVIVDFGGGKFDNAVEYIKDKGATLCVYDPYNRSAEHNKEVLRILRENGGADAAVNSNVLNVIKEPEARKNVLENIARITKPGAPIYITVYEGKGNGQEGPTKSGYQLNRKTADYLEEIQEVFPDATRKGKLITAHNSGSVTSSTVEGSISPEEFFTKDDLINFAIEVVDKINDRINPKHQFDVEDAYFKGSKVYVSIGNDEYSLSGDAIVDMRKIHRSEDLTKYIDTIVTQMIEEYNEQSSVDSSTNIQGAFNDLEDEWLSPPENDPKTYDHDSFQSVIEVDFEEYINVDVNGDWDFEDPENDWASSDGQGADWYDTEYLNLYIDDPSGVAEKIMELMDVKVPAKSGRYRVKGSAHLIYNVEGIYEYHENQTSREDYDNVVVTEDAKVNWDMEKSKLSNFTIDRVR